MQRLLLRARARLRDATKPLGQAAVGALTIGILRIARYFDPIKTANLFGRIARSIGPMMREQKIGRANLTAAFPEKSPAEIEAILAGVWDNVGRLGAEFAHLDHIWEHDATRPEERSARRDAGRPVFDQRRRGYFLRPQDQGQSDAGPAAAADRVPGSWRTHHPPARTPLSCRTVRRSEAGPRHRRANRHSGNDAGGHVSDRGLDPRISRSVAVATPPLAVNAPDRGPDKRSYICERTRRLTFATSSSANAHDPVSRDISD